MLKNFTALYMKLEHGYMGKILEWPGVITEGDDLEDCEEMLKDAAHEMMLGYKDEGLKIPNTSIIVKPISIPIDEEMLENAG
ncbi:MAG: type II toxin-antitoxin system HicB family antitoxin [Synergistaceae bacterium]|nr:type II toxin-antitoxin system HicB family antitoxin [Synergistaceae bacterium]